MCKFLGRLSERGYTLIESLFQLIIFVVFLQLLVLFFLWKAPIERSYTHMSNTEWEMFAADLQKDLERVYEFEVHIGGHGIHFRSDRGLIDIEHGNSVIRKRVYDHGHIPLLTNVYSADFRLRGTVLFVDVMLLDGTQKERDFAIGLYSK